MGFRGIGGLYQTSHAQSNRKKLFLAQSLPLMTLCKAWNASETWSRRTWNTLYNYPGLAWNTKKVAKDNDPIIPKV